MRYCLLISDLHLCASRPAITDDFLAWLNTSASQADALYILGDFFEYWAGDDVLDADTEDATMYRQVVGALKTLSQQGTPVYLMHGNRDFLIGERFCDESGVTRLPDPSVIDLYGQIVLLSHGDALCTDDTEYMAFKAQVRQPDWQAQFLAQPLSERLAFIAQARARSDAEKSSKQMAIMDVNEDAVADLFQAHQSVNVLIHGHTHRPKQHQHAVDGRDCIRWVLGDWYEQGSCLQYLEDGTIQQIPIPNAGSIKSGY